MRKPVTPFLLLRIDLNLLFIYSLLLFRATIEILCDLGMKMQLCRVLTLLIHDNARRIDFFYLQACHDVIKYPFNENITELKIIC